MTPQNMFKVTALSGQYDFLVNWSLLYKRPIDKCYPEGYLLNDETIPLEGLLISCCVFVCRFTNPQEREVKNDKNPKTDPAFGSSRKDE